MLIFPHGIHVDREGNVWVTDGQDNAPTPARGGGGARGRRRCRGGRRGGRRAGRGTRTGAGAASAPRPGATSGHQVFKFSPEGKLLLTLGKAGGAADPTTATSRTTSSPPPTATSSSPRATAPATTGS